MRRRGSPFATQVVLLVVGAALALAGLAGVVAYLQASWVDTDGTVTSSALRATTTSRATTTYYVATASYSVDGSTYEVTGGRFPTPPRTGSTIAVSYNQLRPSEARVGSTEEPPLVPLTVVAIGLGLGLVGGWRLIPRRHARA